MMTAMLTWRWKSCRKFSVLLSSVAAAFLEKDMDEILTKSLDYIEDEMETARTFKVDAKRSDKKFPFKSPEICIEMGGKILERFPHLKVDVHDPDVVVTVEIRETNAYVHAGSIEGAGGIPVGSSGKAMLLLSGGIDSPCCRLYDGKAWCDNIRYPL